MGKKESKLEGDKCLKMTEVQPNKIEKLRESKINIKEEMPEFYIE